MPDIFPPASLLALPTADLLERFAAAKLTPGAGSAAALLGAVAGSLAQAAARYAIKARARAGEASFRERAAVLLAESRELSVRLEQAVDEDASAFQAYWRLLTELRAVPTSAPERADLAARATEALGRATDVPLKIARQCVAVAEIGLELYERGHRNARGEAATAVFSALAGAEAAVQTARLNLQPADEAPWVASRREAIHGLHGQIVDLRRRLEAVVSPEEPAEGRLG